MDLLPKKCGLANINIVLVAAVHLMRETTTSTWFVYSVYLCVISKFVIIFYNSEH